MKKEAYIAFSPDTIIQDIIGRFQLNINNTVKHIHHICSWFIDLFKWENISNNNAVLMTAFKTNILYCYDLDICNCFSRIFNFCYDCLTFISRNRKLKFSISNKMSQLCYYHYLALLEGFSFVEEVIIIRVNLLRLNNFFNLGLYRGVCRDFVLLS